MGRPSSYKPEYVEQAYKLCLLGATDKELADFFGVDERTIYRWKESEEGFCQALKEGKEEADANVAHRLYKRAIGLTVKETRINGGGDNDEAPAAVEVTKELPPDTTAAIFWLKNRQKDKWRDVSRQEVTGKDGEAIKTEEVSMTEVARRMIFILNSGIQESSNADDQEG